MGCWGLCRCRGNQAQLTQACRSARRQAATCVAPGGSFKSALARYEAAQSGPAATRGRPPSTPEGVSKALSANFAELAIKEAALAVAPGVDAVATVAARAAGIALPFATSVSISEEVQAVVSASLSKRAELRARVSVGRSSEHIPFRDPNSLLTDTPERVIETRFASYGKTHQVVSGPLPRR